MLNSKRMYCYTRSIKSFALDFYRIIVIQTSFITGLKFQKTYLNFEIQKLLKATLEFGNHFDENHVQK